MLTVGFGLGSRVGSKTSLPIFFLSCIFCIASATCRIENIITFSFIFCINFAKICLLVISDIEIGRFQFCQCKKTYLNFVAHKNTFIFYSNSTLSKV